MVFALVFFGFQSILTCDKDDELNFWGAKAHGDLHKQLIIREICPNVSEVRLELMTVQNKAEQYKQSTGLCDVLSMCVQLVGFAAGVCIS